MANATRLPDLSEIVFFQWATPSAPSPKLSAPVGPTDTTLTFTSPPYDKSGAVVTEAFLMGIRNDEGYVETVYVPVGALSVDGLTATGVVRGIELEGLDWTAGDTNNAATHQQDSPVFCNITGVMNAIVHSAIQGTVATGGTNFIIGNDAAGTVTISRSTGAGTTAPWLRYNNTGSEVEFSDDGVAWTAINDVTASNLLDVSATDTTPGYLSDKLVSAAGGIDFNILGGGGNETLNLTVDLSEAGITAGPLASVISDVTATEAEIDQALDGISANVTFTNLNTLTAGSSSDATALHTHTSIAQFRSAVAYETITTDDAVALLPVEVRYYTELDDEAGNDIVLGDASARARYAVSFAPTQDVTGVPNLLYRHRQAAGAGQQVEVRIEADSGGEPSGTLVDANATATVAAPGAGTYAQATAAWAGAFNLTQGTTYWIVWAASAIGGNNNEMSHNFDFYQNYLSYERLTYDSFGAAWGNSSTTDIPYFWFATEAALGVGLVPTDADFGARTWNFVGFAKAGGAAQADIDYYYEIVPDLSGLVPGSDYYLSTTAGDLTATSPGNEDGGDFGYKIGKALTTTELKIEPGEKYVFGNKLNWNAAEPEYIIPWFRMTEITVAARMDAGSANSWGCGDGGANEQCAYFNSNSGNGGVNSGQLWYLVPGAGASHTGLLTSVSDIGVVVTNTKGGAPNAFSFLWKIKG